MKHAVDKKTGLLVPPTTGKVFPIHVHTTYSILDGVSTVEDYLDYCVREGLDSCGCTDHGYIMGHYDLLRLSKLKGIKPMPGLEAYLKSDSDTDHEINPDLLSGKKGGHFRYYHLTLLAQSQEGLRNLTCLSNSSWRNGNIVTQGRSLKPMITWKELAQFAEGLICGSGCAMGPVSYPLSRGEPKMAERNLGRLMDMFPGRLFIELVPSPISEDWKKDAICVTNSKGETITFLPDDVIETSLGEMTAKEAIHLRPAIVYSEAKPRFRKTGPIDVDMPDREMTILDDE
jgi:DNA polymerase-3 subunit alpha